MDDCVHGSSRGACQFCQSEDAERARVIAVAEQIGRQQPYGIHYMGVLVDQTWSAVALMGILHEMMVRNERSVAQSARTIRLLEMNRV